MKQKDIALIIIISAVSAGLSFFASNMLFASPNDRQQKVEKVPVIDAAFNEPDKKYFNDQSIDPTKVIRIGDSNNTKPFGSN